MGNRKQEIAGKWESIMFLILTFGFLLVFLSLSQRGEVANVSQNLAELLPESQVVALGWSKLGELMRYERKNLYDYINGGAELYLAYDFQDLLVQNYKDDKGRIITTEIYRFETPEDAYGVYSNDTQGEHPKIGQEATYGAGLLKFWKGKYFVRIFCLEEAEKLKGMILSLGKEIAQKIKETGKKPKLVYCLPKEGLVPESVTYFHKNISLNNLYYLSDVNLLDLNKDTEALIATYKMDTQRLKLLVIKYPQVKRAKEAFKHFNQVYFSDRPAELIGLTKRIEKVEKGEYVGVQLRGNYILLVFKGKIKKISEKLLDRVSKKLS